MQKSPVCKPLRNNSRNVVPFPCTTPVLAAFSGDTKFKVIIAFKPTPPPSYSLNHFWFCAKKENRCTYIGRTVVIKLTKKSVSLKWRGVFKTHKSSCPVVTSIYMRYKFFYRFRTRHGDSSWGSGGVGVTQHRPCNARYYIFVFILRRWAQLLIYLHSPQFLSISNYIFFHFTFFFPSFPLISSSVYLFNAFHLFLFHHLPNHLDLFSVVLPIVLLSLFSFNLFYFNVCYQIFLYTRYAEHAFVR